MTDILNPDGTPFRQLRKLEDVSNAPLSTRVCQASKALRLQAVQFAELDKAVIDAPKASLTYQVIADLLDELLAENTRLKGKPKKKGS